MSLLDRLERIFGRFAVPNLSLYIVIGQVFVLLTRMLHLLNGNLLLYAPVAVVAGQWWRPFTFLFLVDPGSFFGSTLAGYVFLVFGWQIFYLMGSALEEYWGVFRYNVFLFLGWFLTVALAFITPTEVVQNLYLFGSVFLAFAYLNPEFELLLFFILPVKIKWLALITWILYARQLAIGDWADRVQIGASVAAFVLFFGGDIIRRLTGARRTASRRAERAREREQPRHVCFVCGKNDLTHPDLDFRYCSKCAGDQCYCPEHIHNHAHVVAPEPEVRS